MPKSKLRLVTPTGEARMIPRPKPARLVSVSPPPPRGWTHVPAPVRRAIEVLIHRYVTVRAPRRVVATIKGTRKQRSQT